MSTQPTQLQPFSSPTMPVTTPLSTGQPLQGKVLDVTRDMKAGTSDILYTIKIQLQHNNDIRIITDNHKKNKLHHASSTSLSGAWIGTMLDNNINIDDIVRLNIIHKTQAIWQKVDPESNSVPVIDTQPAKQKRKKMIDIDSLLSSNGLPAIYYKFDCNRFNSTKNNEISDLNLLIAMYKEWSHNLCPKLHFQLLMNKIEKFGGNKRVRNYMNNLRKGKLPEECDQIYTGYNEHTDSVTPYSKRRKSAHTIDVDDEMKNFIVNSIELDDDNDEHEEYVDMNQHENNKLQLHKSHIVELSEPEPTSHEQWVTLEYSKLQLEQQQIIDPFADTTNDENNDKQNIILPIDKTIQIKSTVPSNTRPIPVVSLFDAMDDW